MIKALLSVIAVVLSLTAALAAEPAEGEFEGECVMGLALGKVIKTEKLWWNRDVHRVQSDTLVQIETPQGDVMRGKGLDAAEDFSWWTLKRSVSGEFPNFRERVESDDPILGRDAK